MGIYDDLIPGNKSSGTTAAPTSYGIYSDLVPKTSVSIPYTPPTIPPVDLSSPTSIPFSTTQTSTLPIAQSNTTSIDPVSSAVNNLKDLWSTWSQVPSKISEDIQAGSENFAQAKSEVAANQGNDTLDSLLNVYKGFYKAGVRTAGDVAIALFAPISAAIGTVMGSVGGQQLIDGTGQVIANSSGITNLPMFQKFAMTHPNAGEDFNRLSMLVMSGAETGEINPTKVWSESKSIVSKILDQAKQPNSPVKLVSANQIPEAVKTEPTAVETKPPVETPAVKPNVPEAQPVTTIPPELQPSAQGQIYYHATSAEAANSIEQSGFKAQIGERSLGVANAEGVWLYEDKGATTEFGKNFSRVGKTPAVVETKVNGKIFDATNEDRSIRAIVEDKPFITKLRTEGYVGVKGDELGTSATFVFEPKALQVVKNTPSLEAPKQTPVPKGEAISTRGADVLNAAKEKGMISETGPLPTHEKMSVSAEDAKAREYINQNPDEALSKVTTSAKSEDPYIQSVYKELETKAIKGDNVAMMQALSKSDVPIEAGRSLKLLDSNDPNNPVKIMRDVRNAREQAIEKKLGSFKKSKAKVVTEESAKLSEEIKNSVSKRPTWEAFIKELTCNS